MLFSIEQAFVGRNEKRAPLKTPALERQVQNAGHRSQVTGHRAQGTGHRAQGTGYRLQGTGHRS